MEQLLKEQEEEFVTTFNWKAIFGENSETERNMWNWHKKSMKAMLEKLRDCYGDYFDEENYDKEYLRDKLSEIINKL